MANHRKRNQKGRNPNTKFVQLDSHLLDCDAYRCLSCNARALYTEFKLRFAPSRNGAIPFSVREMAASINKTEKTASNAVAELVEKGFVICRQKGAFSLKLRHASEWELTEYEAFGQSAKKTYMSWEQERKNHGRKNIHSQRKKIPA